VTGCETCSEALRWSLVWTHFPACTDRCISARRQPQ